MIRQDARFMSVLTPRESMMMLGSVRRKVPVPALVRWLLGLGIAATLAPNVAHGLAVLRWPRGRRWRWSVV
jgi:hypothetical protein